MKHSLHHVRNGLSAGRLTSGRSAFTLLELVLALAVLVTLATLSWPGMLRTLKQQTVQGNAEQVRQILDQARVRAIEEGQVLQFRYEPNGTRFVLLPFDPVDETQSGTSMTSSNGSRTAGASPERVEPYRVYSLAEGCRFHIDSSLMTGERTETERLGQNWIGHLQNGSGMQDVSWSSPWLYFPDGAATDGTLVVMDKEQRYIRLNVRGLTGAVSAEPIAVMTGRLATTGN